MIVMARYLVIGAPGNRWIRLMSRREVLIPVSCLEHHRGFDERPLWRNWGEAIGLVVLRTRYGRYCGVTWRIVLSFTTSHTG